MTAILVATDSGCRVLRGTGEGKVELAGRKLCALAPDVGGACLAVVDEKEVWRRSADSTWSKLTAVDIGLQSIMSSQGTIYCGGTDEAAIGVLARQGVEGLDIAIDALEHPVAGNGMNRRKLRKVKE